MPIVEIRRLSYDEEVDLVERAKTDDSAMHQLVNQYLPMFMSIAKDYFYNGRSHFRHLPEKADIAQASFEPFQSAVKDYDPSLGYKFHTLAQRYIRQHLDNLRKAERTKGRAPHVPVIDPETGEETSKVTDPMSIEEPVGGREQDEPRRLAHIIQDVIKSRPEWRAHYDQLVKDVDDRLNSDLKKAVFRKLVERDLFTDPDTGEVRPQVGRMKEIQQELGLEPSTLSNILGRDIYPAVSAVIEGS